MADAFLNNGAVSLAAANWSDATGFADAATLIVDRGSATSFSDIDYSALTNGIDTFTVLPGFTGGLQGADGSPLKFDCDYNTTKRFSYGAGGGVARYLAGGGSGVCTNIENVGNGDLYLMGGTFTNAALTSGSTSVNGSSVVTNLRVAGGSNVVAYNATALTVFEQTGGYTVLKRGVATGVMNGGVLEVDFDDGGTTTGTFGSTSFQWNGGKIILKNGHISNFVWRGGSLDVRALRRAATIGGTSFTIYPGIVGYLAQAPNGVAISWQTATKIATSAGSSQMFSDR